MNLTITIISLVGIVLIGIWNFSTNRYNEFQKKIRVGDSVGFLFEGEMTSGFVMEIDKLYFHLQTIHGIKKVLKSYVHPINGWHYEK